MTHIPLSWSEYAANKIKMYFLSEPTSESRLPRMAELDSDVQVHSVARRVNLRGSALTGGTLGLPNHSKP